MLIPFSSSSILKKPSIPHKVVLIPGHLAVNGRVSPVKLFIGILLGSDQLKSVDCLGSMDILTILIIILTMHEHKVSL